MKLNDIKKFLIKNYIEVTVWIILIFFSGYVLFATSIKIWMRIIFSIVILLMGFEIVQRIKGKPSYIESMQDSMEEEMDEFNKGLEQNFNQFDITLDDPTRETKHL